MESKRDRDDEISGRLQGVQLLVLIWSNILSPFSFITPHCSLVRQVQCEQHALTIVALEDKLLTSVHEVTQLRGEKAELQNKIRELEEQIGDPSKHTSC